MNILTWAGANPGLMAAVTWPFVLALLTLILKPRTAAQYADLALRKPVWFYTRWAAFLQLLGAAGFDPIKVTQVLPKVIMGTVWVPQPHAHFSVKPPSGPEEEEVE